MMYLVMTACVLGQPKCDPPENVLSTDYVEFCEIAKPGIAREVRARLGNKAKFTFECRRGDDVVETESYRQPEADPIGDVLRNVLGRVVR